MADSVENERNVAVNAVVRERRTLREWTATVSLRTPNFLLHYSDIVAFLESFPPCKIDVSPKEDLLAMMSHNRELEIYDLLDEKMVVRARVKVLEERYPEWCLLKFTASGSLLISTRSNAILDVFDPSGGYCYSVAVSKTVDSFNAASVICDMTSVSPSNETTKYLDTLYTLQFNSVFSCYKLGLLVGYISLFKVDLGLSLTSSFVLIPSIDLVIVAGQHRRLNDTEEIDCNSSGLNVYRVVNEEPYVVDIRVSKTQFSLCEVLTGWLPFRTPQTGIVVSMAANRKYTQLSVISSTGDVSVFDLPSMRLVKYVPYCDGLEKPVQTLWINREELAILTRRGSLLRGKPNKLEFVMMDKPEDVEVFGESTGILSPKSGVLFALESKILSSEGSRSLKKNRAWLAAKLRLTTLYDYIKAYIDAAIGQPLVEVPEAIEKREVKMALHEIRSVTLQNMFKKMLSRGDFAGALELSQKHNIEDVNFVYKEQWRQLGDSVNAVSVETVLSRISDENWVLMECMNSRACEMQTHGALISLAKRITGGRRDAQRALALHYERIFNIVEAIKMTDEKINLFLEFRSHSFLELAMYFAKAGQLENLEKYMIKRSVLRPYLFTLLLLIPEVIPAEKYEFLIPYNRNDWFAIEFEDDSDSLLESPELPEGLEEVVEKLNFETHVYKKNESLAKYIDNGELKLDIILDLCRTRCFQIDVSTGLIELIIDFIQLAVSHGFKEMEGFLLDILFYRDFVVFCGLVSLSLEQFNTSSSDVVFKAIIKHMTEKDVCTNMSRILKLLEYLSACGRCASLNDQLLSFLRAYSCNSLHALECVQKLRPAWLNQEILIACFCTYEVIGQKLIESVRKANLSAKYAQALEAFSVHKFEPRFEQLHASFADSAVANQMVYRLIRSASCASQVQWRELRNHLLHIHSSFYSELLTREEILKILAQEMLDMNNTRKTRDLVGMIFSFTPTEDDLDAGRRLSREASLNMLIEKSDSFYNSAMPERSDLNLRLAREVLSLAPLDCSARLSKHLKQLDALDLALQLGCKLLPVKFRHTDPEILFGDIIRNDANYKKVKDCARLAQLLGIRTPVARAMQLCAVEALLKRDVRTLRKYCEQLLKISESHSLPQGIHSLCIDVLRSNLLTEMDEELLTCALLSCPPEDILETLSLVQERSAEHQFPSTSSIRPTSELMLDPMYTSIEEYRLNEAADPVPLDEPTVHVDYLYAENRPAFNNTVANLVRHYSHISTTMALNLSLLLPEEVDWTENVLFSKYSHAVRDALKELPLRSIQLLPPLFLVKKYANTLAGETALERILNSGCDRERFVEDFRYRDETLKGIAMTTDAQVIRDCIEVAEKYHMDAWGISMSSLDYALTDPEVSILSLRSFLTDADIMDRLRSNRTRFYAHLRSNTFRAVCSTADRQTRLKIYLSLFENSETEHDWLVALRSIEENFGDCDLTLLLNGESSKAASEIVPFLSRNCEQLVEDIRRLPNGSSICDSAAYIVFSSEKQDAEHLRKCFYLLEKDPERVIDFVGTLPVADEIAYLESALKECTFDPPMSSLRSELMERVHSLQRISEPPQAFSQKSFESSSPTGSLRRRHH